MADNITKKEKNNLNNKNNYQKIMIKNIKHDLTNPINAIQGYAELILEILQNDKDVDLQDDINGIYKSALIILRSINKKFKVESNSEINNIIW